MELILIILFVLIVILFYKINLLNKYISVLSFSEKNINKLLIKKNIISPSDVDVIINESLGDMHESIGNKIIKDAKDIGIFMPSYMNEEELKSYIEKQELRRRNNEISYTDKMLMKEEE